jgi:hypothetical protein
MKNSELWSQYSTYTSEFTKFSRQLAFAAVAICWFFKSHAITFPVTIVFALSFLVLFFISDILQFFISAHLLRWWVRKEEKIKWKSSNPQTIEGEYNKPWWVDLPAFIFFNIKAFVLCVSFVFIGLEFLGRI